MPTMKLTQYAKSIGVHPKTAYAWHRKGIMPHPTRQLTKRTIVVDVPDGLCSTTAPSGLKTGAGIYARVSSTDQKTDLERQTKRLQEWAERNNMHIVRVESEIASGMNGNRRKAQRILADPAVKTIIVERRDRLGRMNVELIEAALRSQNRKLVILDDDEIEDDLVSDMVDILTSFCARLYGRRSARNRALKAVECASEPVSVNKEIA